MTQHPTIARSEWHSRRTQLLEKEKAFTRAKDELAAARRELPWVRVEKPYVFEGAAGKQALAQLFGSASQLLVYHFMFAPDAQRGCSHCAFWADHFDSATPHLAQRDVAFAVVSRAPFAKLDALRRSVGWNFNWVSSEHSDFNYDFQVSFRADDRATGTAEYNYAPHAANMPSEMPGFSAFFKDEAGAIFHTYSTYGRGIELANSTYQLLDLMPKGRAEQTTGNPMNWVKYRHEYPRGA
jgi:predicted dithiol-disulfide oxidoreductase (DUF899 family)